MYIDTKVKLKALNANKHTKLKIGITNDHVFKTAASN